MVKKVPPPNSIRMGYLYCFLTSSVSNFFIKTPYFAIEYFKIAYDFIVTDNPWDALYFRYRKKEKSDPDRIQK